MDIIQKTLDNLLNSPLLMPLATLVLAFLPMPEPPMVLKKVASSDWMKWIAVFIMVYQGGANGDVAMSALMAGGLFIAYKVLKN